MVNNNNIKYSESALPRALRKNQRKWKRKFKKVDLRQLIKVCTFAVGDNARVSLVQLPGEPDSAFVLKTMKKAHFKTKSARKFVLTEKKILAETKSDFVLRLYRTYKDKRYLHILTEYCPGGNMSARGRFSEDDARFYGACIVEALDCLHSVNVVHNDLNPTNMVLDADGYLKVIDMSHTTIIEPGEFDHSLDGTVEYLPPEVIFSQMWARLSPVGRNRSVDLWALGVILYEWVRGRHAFVDVNKREMTRFNISRGIGEVKFPKRYFSKEAKDLIQKLCGYFEWERLGYKDIEEIRQHPWFKNFNWDDLRDRTLKPPTVPELCCPVDTSYFVVNHDDDDDDDEVTSDSDAEEDLSDWDAKF